MTDVMTAPTRRATNPLRTGLATDRLADPCSIVFFGASGDLFKRMLFPAIYALREKGMLPAAFGLVGFSRSKYSDDAFRQYCHDQLSQFSANGAPSADMWDEFSERISYVSADFDDERHYADLKAILEHNDETLRTGSNRLFYLSTPPSLFPKIVKNLAAVGLDPRSNTKGWTRIIIEKPFGIDLASARALQAEIEEFFDERSIYRIDHYLGKEPVQDLLALRFANTIFEPIWNRNYVDNVQITAAETLGVESRGGYYETSGALRDMLQNHVLNLLALVAMEPPTDSGADAIRTEKYKVFAAIEPPTARDFASISARGQYGPGSVSGDAVPGYRTEADVDPASNTETFAALKLFVQNWRWAGVPFYVRSGKRLARKCSEIAVTFKPVPHRLYGERTDSIEPNVLVAKIQPDEGISLRFEAKVPGPKQHIRSVFMDFNYGSGFGIESPPAYERLLADAMRGDQTLFTRWDAVEKAWEIVEPVLEYWRSTPAEFPNYEAGGQGPKSAFDLFAGWRQL